MITAKIEYPFHLARKEFFDWLGQNKTMLLQQKRLAGKEADGVAFVSGGHVLDMKGNAVKATSVTQVSTIGAELQVKAAINTTNWMDSHLDVHFPGLWKKNLSENKHLLMMLQEHDMSFKSIIADGADLKAYTKKMTWRELGMDYDGSTEVLIFEATVKKSRNEFMFGEYAQGHVKNHSVRIQYVRVELCVNSEEKYWRDEKENWDKYISQVTNKEFAEEIGFFWAVLEGKAIEGSAVVRGSNIVTPTLMVSSKSAPPDDGTQTIEPGRLTHNVLKALQTKNIFLE